MTRAYTPEGMMFRQAGVDYTRDQKTGTEHKMRRCYYLWKYLPTGTQGISNVFLFQEKGLTNLLEHWSNQQPEHWEYSSLPADWPTY
jgi:hypothetical protein